jgi:hypothetical protein
MSQSKKNPTKKKSAAVATETTQSTTNTINRSIRFPKAIMDVLEARAEKMDRSVNWLVNRAVQRDLESGNKADPCSS